ncbi:MAG TPA: flagellar assembly peptidoglycan hydrolase FlgJ, partial [Burkholderiaceae bacterium]|nr:flagellar assembly peptidoglycan hydrolase FlgJ [Burkholderiaceae bacterium]
PDAVRAAAATASAGTSAAGNVAGGLSGTGGSAARFVERHRAAADAAAAESGIPAEFMLAQAAHETGWGRREIRGADGTNSFNLFGIKAGGNWKGPVVVATTTEVIDGRPQKVQAAFRAYGSYEESYRDYARLISTSPRYSGVMQVTNDAQAFASGLQRAGYATDPEYAAKLGRVIQTTRRLVDAAGASAGPRASGVTA